MLLVLVLSPPPQDLDWRPTSPWRDALTCSFATRTSSLLDEMTTAHSGSVARPRDTIRPCRFSETREAI